MQQIRFVGDEPREVVFLSGVRKVMEPGELFTAPDEEAEGLLCQPHFFSPEDSNSAPVRKAKKD